MSVRDDPRRAEQRACRATRRRSADRVESKVLRDAGDDLPVGVLANHHHDALRAMMIQQWKKLTMPQHEDYRLLGRAKPPNVVIVRDANAPGETEQPDEECPDPDDPGDAS